MKMRACREIEQKQQQQTSQKLGQSKAHFSKTTEQHQRIYTELCSKIEIDVTATLAVVSGVCVRVYASFHSVYGKSIFDV